MGKFLRRLLHVLLIPSWLSKMSKRSVKKAEAAGVKALPFFSSKDYPLAKPQQPQRTISTSGENSATDMDSISAQQSLVVSPIVSDCSPRPAPPPPEDLPAHSLQLSGKSKRKRDSLLPTAADGTANSSGELKAKRKKTVESQALQPSLSALLPHFQTGVEEMLPDCVCEVVGGATIAVALQSPEPAQQLLESMVGMINYTGALPRGNHSTLSFLLFCYLRLNEPHLHRFIQAIFLQALQKCQAAAAAGSTSLVVNNPSPPPTLPI